MEMKGKQIRVSVRNLVEFVLRSGDLDNRRTAVDQCWREAVCTAKSRKRWVPATWRRCR